MSLQLRGANPLEKPMKGPVARFTFILVHTPVSRSRGEQELVL